MMHSAAVTDDELLEVVRTSFADRAVTSLRRRPYRYATSASLEELRVGFADGDDTTLILKDLARERFLDDARRSKPEFLYEPRRDLEAHRRILIPEGIGARCYAAVDDPERSRYWLLLEKVAGVELWQIGELEVWEAVARWLAAFHARFAGRVVEVRATNPYLLEYQADLFRLWAFRAREALNGSGDPRAADLLRALERYDDVVDALARLPATFVHGEFYPSNVLVVGTDPAGLRVCPIDWEMAATGPGLLDVAALTGGWDAARRDRLVRAYHSTATELGDQVRSLPEMTADVDRCRLHLALQWLGWSDDWQAPPEHAHDWIDEALELARGLTS
jgi:Ser/Thr protein kinase RdoA (MazF antagonist)